jgi:D-3-phosphoglycerate dehydrogenase
LADEGVEFFDQECTTDDEVIVAARGADVVWVITSLHLLTARTVAGLPRCVAFVRSGSGTDNVDVEAATRAGIVVANTPGAVSETTADHTVGLLCSVVRRIPYADRLVKDGLWDPFRAAPLGTLHRRTLGLVGFGRVGRGVAKRVTGFDMDVLAYDPYVPAETMAELGVRKASLEDVLRSADFVSLHLPLLPETRNLIGERELRMMQKDAYLINCARGPIVDEQALYRALSEGWIAGAGLDVMAAEPPDPTSPLLQLENVVVNPHIAGLSELTTLETWRTAAETIIDLSHGRWPRSVVNPAVRPRCQLRAR